MGVDARRILVAAEAECPAAALRAARALAGRAGEVVLAAVLVVPHGQPLGATLDRAVAEACATLDRGDRADGGAAFDTRMVRSRSFAEGVLGLLAAEPFHALVLQAAPDGPRNGARAQVEALVQRAGTTVVLVRPAVAA